MVTDKDVVMGGISLAVKNLSSFQKETILNGVKDLIEIEKRSYWDTCRCFETHTTGDECLIAERVLADLDRVLGTVPPASA